MIFCDTSTLAKFYVPEKESRKVRERLEAEPDGVALSELARVEILGVFHRRLRERKWSRQQFSAAVGQLHRDHTSGFWTWLPLDTSIIDQSVTTFMTLPAHLFLRTADCLHLTTAIHHGFAELYTYDRHQMEAAAALSLNAIQI